MKIFNFNILFFALCFGLMLGFVDAGFDYRYHYQGSNSFTGFLANDFPMYEVFWRGSFLFFSLGCGFIVSYVYNKRKDSEIVLHNIFNNTLPICITDNNYQIIMANKSYYDIFGSLPTGGKGAKCYESRPGPKCKGSECPINVIRDGREQVFTCEAIKIDSGNPSRTFIVTATPYLSRDSEQIGIIESFQDITSRKLLEQEKEQLIDKLNKAVQEVKKLSGFLPICANCKKIRDDKGYWQQVESYISEHSDAVFSHSICPQCAANHYASFNPAGEPTT